MVASVHCAILMNTCKMSISSSALVSVRTRLEVSKSDVTWASERERWKNNEKSDFIVFIYEFCWFFFSSLSRYFLWLDRLVGSFTVACCSPHTHLHIHSVHISTGENIITFLRFFDFLQMQSLLCVQYVVLSRKNEFFVLFILALRVWVVWCMRSATMIKYRAYVYCTHRGVWVNLAVS